jgi:hypothetical protein
MHSTWVPVARAHGQTGSEPLATRAWAIMRVPRTLGLAALLLPTDTIGGPPACTERTPTTNVFRVTTLPFTATGVYGAPARPLRLTDAGLSAEFTSANGSAALRGRGYWDGGQAWKVRFAAPEPGCWSWATSCLPRSAGDAGLWAPARA